MRTNYGYFCENDMIMIEILLEKVTKRKDNLNFDLHLCFEKIQEETTMFDNYHYEEVIDIYNKEFKDLQGDKLMKSNWDFEFKLLK